MKKSIIFILLSIANIGFAQKTGKFIQDIKIGGIVATVASTDFSKSEKPFTLGYNLFAVVTIKAPKTFHNIFYGFGDNSFNSLNGYILKNNWDTYVVYSKTLHTDKNYLGFGVEKMEMINHLKLFLFTEVGTGFSGKKLLTCGILMNLSWSVK
jgi:hypothetical protein